MSEQHLIDTDFEAKLAQELDSGRPYEAFQFAQSYLARKFSPSTSLFVLNRMVSAVDIFMKMGCGAQAGYLLVWFLDQKIYLAELSSPALSVLMGSIRSTLRSNDPEQSGTFADIVFMKIVDFIESRAHECGTSASEVICGLGEALGRVGRWEQATYLLSRDHDMQKLSFALHNWASLAYKSEYPLFFARMVLTFLNSKRQEDAASLVRHSQELIDEYMCSASKEKRDCASSIAVWNFSSILCDIVGLGTSLSVKEKADTYALLRKKYKYSIQHPDPTLATLADKIAIAYKLNRVSATNKAVAPQGGGLASMIKKNLRSKM